MAKVRIRFIAAGMGMVVLVSSSAFAQALATFSWQMQPYCNVVTMTVTQVPSGFTVDGFDEQCGAVKRASSIGMALINPDGTVGLEFTIVPVPSGRAGHVSATINLGTGSGTWTDGTGNSGAFVLGGAVPGLSARPIPTGAVAPETITALEIAPGAVGASEIAPAAVGVSEIANGAVRAIHLGGLSLRSQSVAVPAGEVGAVSSTCAEGERVLSGGFAGTDYDVFVTASRRQGNGWVVSVRNTSILNRTITVHANCLVP